MSLMIEDLDESNELDADARKALMGGSSVAQGIGSGGVTSDLAVNAGGLLFASPVTTVNLVMPVYANTQTATALDMTNLTNTMSMVGSILDGTGIST